MLMRGQDERWSFGDNGMTAHARSLGGIGTDMAPVSVSFACLFLFCTSTSPGQRGGCHAQFCVIDPPIWRASHLLSDECEGSYATDRHKGGGEAEGRDPRSLV